MHLRTVLLLLLCWGFFLPVNPARAGRIVDSEDLEIDLGGDLKSFLDLVVPYEHLLMPEDPQPSGALDFRLKFEGSYKDWLSWKLHHVATASLFPAGSGEMSFGVATRPGPSSEGLPLSWIAAESDGFRLSGRLDRASFSLHAPGLDITFGRQPISFGSGYFFTPLDLLTPYSPQVVDREYKPGVDAVRFDGFFGETGRLTAVVGVADSPDLDGFFVVASGGFTVGLFDLDFFAGKLHRDVVLGVSTQGSLGPVGVHGDLAVTVPYEEDVDEDPFVRVVLGADGRTGFGMTLMGEVYVQSLGAEDPEDYISVALSDRFQRGDLWTMGRFYGALTVSQEILPILQVSVVTIVNILDPSALLGLSLSWSVATNADFVVGGFFALGERPADLELADLLGPDGLPAGPEQALAALQVGSEFGLLPHQGYAQFKLYF